MSQEVADMISLRHSAEQRGHFSPLGRLLWLDTEHGRIEFPRVDGVADGPDIAVRLATPDELRQESNRTSRDPVEDLRMRDFVLSESDQNTLLVLGAWHGLPAVRVNKTKARMCPGDGCRLKTGTAKSDCTVCSGSGTVDAAVPCRACLHACDACGETGEKLCELCGGNGWTPGNWLPCPGPGCNKDTGNYKADCATCSQSMTRGMVQEHVTCRMCGGSKKMTCPQCKGAKKYSTGRLNGSVNWDGPACAKCDGTCKAGEWRKQDEKKFANAAITQLQSFVRKSVKRTEWLALGPIHSFGLLEFESRTPRIYDVTHDSKNDLLMLLVPAGRWRRGAKAYLVGGIVRERGAREAVGA